MLNYLFVRDVLTKSMIPPFQNYFNKSENLHQHNIRHAKQNNIYLIYSNNYVYNNNYI